MNLTNIQLSKQETSIIIIDQRLLPNKIEYIELHTPQEFYDAIRLLKVRGAPAIGIFVAFAMYVLSKSCDSPQSMRVHGDYLKSARPTAVNLHHAVERMLQIKDFRRLREEAFAIYNEDVAMCKAISENGLTLLKDGDTVLTHCNAGPLATSRYGTGLGPLILGTERGMKLKAYVDETRPLLQGARITALELQNARIPFKLICDNMVAEVMRRGLVNAVFVGCDRVAANGDVANKVGTLGVAIIARHYGVPFYVCCPSTTRDYGCKTGADIVIEERDSRELTEIYFKERVAPHGVDCFNPSFDVTPAELITGIVTEKGIDIM